MKFQLPELPRRIDDEAVHIGDVYKAKGGAGTTRFWVVVGMTARMCACLGVDREGAVVSGTNYSISVFQARDRIGTVSNIENMSFQVEWEQA